MEEERSHSTIKQNPDEINKRGFKKSKSDLEDETQKNYRTIKVSGKNIKYILESFDEIKKKEEKISLQSFEIQTLVPFSIFFLLRVTSFID